MKQFLYFYRNINKKMKKINSLYELLNAIAILENLEWEDVFKIYVNALHKYAFGPSEDDNNIRSILKTSYYSPLFDPSQFKGYALLKRGNHFYALIKENDNLLQFGCIDPETIDTAEEYIMYVKDFHTLQNDYHKRNNKIISDNFEYTNLNPNGNLVGDCSIRSLSFAMHIDWHEALDILANQGFEQNELHFNAENVVEKVLEKYGYVKHKHLPVRLTCLEFCKKMDTMKMEGDMLLYAGDFHITVISKINGNYRIVDSWDCSKELAGTYFTLERKIEEINYTEKIILHPVYGEGIVIKHIKDKLYVSFDKEDKVLALEWVKENCKII